MSKRQGWDWVEYERSIYGLEMEIKDLDLRQVYIWLTKYFMWNLGSLNAVWNITNQLALSSALPIVSKRILFTSPKRIKPRAHHSKALQRITAAQLSNGIAHQKGESQLPTRCESTACFVLCALHWDLIMICNSKSSLLIPSAKGYGWAAFAVFVIFSQRSLLSNLNKFKILCHFFLLFGIPAFAIRSLSFGLILLEFNVLVLFHMVWFCWDSMRW